MNNIEILEELINTSKEYNQYNGNKYYKAIENLIQENKELKMQLEVEKIDNKYNKEETYEETIPRYKIKEKIKEFNAPIMDVLDKLPLMPRTIERGCGAKDGIIYVLQELLEGE